MLSDLHNFNVFYPLYIYAHVRILFHPPCSRLLHQLFSPDAKMSFTLAMTELVRKDRSKSLPLRLSFACSLFDERYWSSTCFFDILPETYRIFNLPSDKTCRVKSCINLRNIDGQLLLLLYRLNSLTGMNWDAILFFFSMIRMIRWEGVNKKK